VAKFRRARWGQRRGAEPRDKVRARSLSRRDWLEVTAVIAALSLIALGVHKLREPGALPIQRVHFENGPINAAREELTKAVAPRLVGNFFTVDLTAIERALTGLGWVKDATVRRKWPDTLLVRIREHVAVARWGKNALLSGTGEIFRPQGGHVPADLPVLHGPAGRQHNLLTHYRRISDLLRPIDLRARALVEDERRAWHLLLDNGIPVDIGRGDPDGRVARFTRVYRQVLGVRARYVQSVDLRYTNGFAVAWKQSDEAHGGAVSETTSN
jgi:cell division protein FtsQ